MLCRKEGQLPIFTSARLLCSDQTMMSYQWHEDTVCVHSSQRYEIHDLTLLYSQVSRHNKSEFSILL